MIIVIELIKDVAGPHIFHVVVYNFYHQQEFCLVLLLSNDKGLEVYLYYAMVPISMAI